MTDCTFELQMATKNANYSNIYRYEYKDQCNVNVIVGTFRMRNVNLTCLEYLIYQSKSNEWINQSKINESVNQPIKNQSNRQSIYQSNQSINWLINHSIGQSNKQSFNQSINVSIKQAKQTNI